MKKVMLTASLGAALMSGAANAVTVYKKDGLTYKIGGDFQVQLRQKAGEDQDLKVDYDDAEIKNSIVWKLDSGTKIFAQADYDLKKEKSEETYVGMDFGNFKWLIGDTDLPTDDFGHESQWEGSSEEDAFVETASDDQVQLHFKLGGGKLALALDVEDAAEENPKVEIDALYSTEFGGLDFAVGYQSVEETPGAESIDTFGVALGTKVGGIKLGLDYSSNDNVDIVHVMSKFGIAPKTSMVIGLEKASFDASEDVNSWYVNWNYKLNKKATLLAEIHNTDEDNSDAGYLAGLRVKF